MRRLKAGATVALAAAGVVAAIAANAYAFPSMTSACTGCHNGVDVPVTATLASTAGTTATYNVSAPGADAIAVFDGSAKVASITGATGQFGVATGKTYRIYSVTGPGTSDGLGQTTVSPVAPPVVDATAPVTTSNAQASYVSQATITLTATDSGSGVAATYYRLDNGAQVAGRTVTLATVGAHTVQFWSVDVAGNTEAAKSASFTITAPPATPSTDVATSTVTIDASRDRVRRGTRIAIYGILAPALEGDTVELYVMKPSSSEWTYLTTVAARIDDDDDDARFDDDDDETAVADAAWNYRFRGSARGLYRFQVRFAGDESRAASVSEIISVVVR